jgi:cytochrome c-type biogenesis protein CcmH
MNADERSSLTANPSTGAAFEAKIPQKPRQIWSLSGAAILLCRNLRSSAFICGSTIFFSFIANVHAQLPTPALPPATPELEARLKKLETELRCLVCQNQTLADSPAGLAGDLRREVRLLADQGKSNEEIKAHLKARYGDFVLYKPDMQPKTWLLWGGPFVLLAGGAAIFFYMNRRRKAPVESEPAEKSDNERAKKMLDDDDDK